MSSEEDRLSSETRTDIWLSAAQESLKLCRKCGGLAKHSSTWQCLLSAHGLQFRTELGYLRTSARRGCPLCSLIFGKLQYDLENTPELQMLRKRSPKIFTRSLLKRQTRSYRISKLLCLQMRCPWNDYSGKDEPLDEDLEQIEMRYKIPNQMSLPDLAHRETQWKRLLEFDICAIPGDAMADLISMRPLTENPSSEESFHQAREWIKECCANHPFCPKAGKTLPTRVIDIGEPMSDSTPKLYVTNDDRAPYVALSYCWGEPPPKPQPPQPVMTTKSTMREFTSSLPVSDLPQTIKDAIHTTRQLGFRYLWVDVICILQDDKVDKRREIRKMKEIFSNAIVTISAACADSCQKGFLYQRDLYRDSFYHRMRGTRPPYVSVEYPPFLLPFRCPNGRLGSLILHRWMTTRAAPEPINSRAWTLEERLLSPRVLAYSSIQVLWECQDGLKMLGPNIFELIHQPRLKQIVFEHNQHQLAASQNAFNVASKLTASETQCKSEGLSKTEDLRESWIEILIDYTPRKMTLAEDKLLAISGIAAVFSGGFSTSQYKAGLWFATEESSLFLLDLLWHVEDRKPIQNAQDARPSWSWAAIEGGVTWYRDGANAYMRSKSNVTCTLLECSTILESDDSPFGNVKSGRLQICGPVKKFKTITSERYSNGMSIDAQGKTFNITKVLDSQGAEVPSFPTFLDTSTVEIGSREDEIEFSTVWALLLLRNMGLILRPVSLEDGIYRRIGIFFWLDDEPWFDNSDLQKLTTVTII